MVVGTIALLSGGAGYLVSQTLHPEVAAAEKTSITSPQPGSQPALDSLLNLTLPTADGKKQNIRAWRGKILVINFWATWCPPCKEEMPAFSALHVKFADKNVQFVGISIDEADKVREFNASAKISYPLLIGNMATMDTTVALGNQLQALPFTVIVDTHGKLHSVKLGRLSESELEKRLLSLLHQ